MFCCDNCHNPKKHTEMFRSIGLCEVCGKRAACIDCHDVKCDPVKEKSKGKSDV